MENRKSGLSAPGRHSRLRPAAYATLLAMAALVMLACSRTPAEMRLRRQVEAMQQAVAERDVRGFMRGVADDFTGNGGIGRDALHNLVRAQVLANANVGVVAGPLEATVTGETARVRFQVALTGGSGRFVPDSAQAYDIDSSWREEDGQWRVFHARWEPKL